MLYGVLVWTRNLVRRNRAVHQFSWRARKAVWALQSLRERRRPIVDAGPILIETLKAERSFAAGKIGSVELFGLRHFLKREEARAAGAQPPPYPQYALETLFINAGVFPCSDESFDQFGAIYRDAVSQMDMLAAWGLSGEARVHNDLAPQAAVVTRISLEPYFQDIPWTAALAGKRVLVVSPFAGTIESQYRRHAEIWPGRDVLPAFAELLTVRAPLSAGVAPPEHASWTDALEDMKRRMDAVQYDVALIGAGAFSLPLATHAKSCGAAGIHMGGSLQLLFGVIGNRWREDKEFQVFFNDAWVSPNASETPESAGKIENACYW
ncbi:hypothetical protein [Methylocella sp.]|uniref:hypothetical protein n=1 Tax=Methylocella sp. TaxID=1978226 RepID=UPI0035B3EBEB